MNFDDLNFDDIARVRSYYNEKDLSKSKAQFLLADMYEVSPRTIRKWANLLGLNTMPKSKPTGNEIVEGARRVLIIGDMHEPFCLEGYYEHCLKIQEKYQTTDTVFIGDIIDNHFSSYHETDSEALGGGDELDLAVDRLKKWYKSFPNATVTLGNHDIMIMRKAQSSAIPTKWIKAYKDVLEVPKWNFVDEIVIDNVLYQHGIGSKAHIKTIKNMMSTVGGHHHTDGYIMYYVGKNSRNFGMQVGCGIDIRSYAMAYGKWFPKPFISCAVVLDDGRLPILEPMEL